MKNIQKTLLLTSQELKRLKDNMKLFKKERKTLESELNEIEKRYKQLKTKHQHLHKTLENKCNYWITVDELLLKLRTKTNNVNDLIEITPDSDILTNKYMEAVLKNLKVIISNYLFYN